MRYPSPVSALVKGQVTQVSTGKNFSCFLLLDGVVYCCGSNSEQQFQSPGGGKVMSPTAVTGLPNVISMALGSEFTCLITSEESKNMWCQGKIPGMIITSVPLVSPEMRKKIV